MPSLPATAQPQPDDLLPLITSLKAQQKVIQAELDAALDLLTEHLQNGDIDPAFAYEDWRFTFTKGRTTVSYSDNAKAAIKAIQESDLAAGFATQKQGAGFWTIKPPAL